MEMGGREGARIWGDAYWACRTASVHECDIDTAGSRHTGKARAGAVLSVCLVLWLSMDHTLAHATQFRQFSSR